MHAKRGSNHQHMQAGLMGSMSSPDPQQKPNLNITCTNPNSCAITIDTHISHIADVDKLELESYTRRCRHLELALQEKQREHKGRDLTEHEVADIERRIDATEAAGRVAPRTITITHSSGATESADVSALPHSYTHIRNLLWIQHHPIYKTALAEWRRQVGVFGSRVERKISRSGNLKNEIYNLIGFYSVFQGVLLGATIQSNYLHCRNVGLPIALSTFASLCTLVALGRKFNVIYKLETTIASEIISLKEAKSRILKLKEKGEEFRFSDFLEEKEARSSPNRKFHLFGLRSRFLMKTKFVNGTSSVITLKEANSGIQRFLFKLAKKDQYKSSFEMELDTNATYREYHLFVIPSSSAGIVVSSDHLIDNKVITIMEVDAGVFSWEGTPRNDLLKKPDQRSGTSEGPTKFLERWLSTGISTKALKFMSAKPPSNEGASL